MGLIDVNLQRHVSVALIRRNSLKDEYDDVNANKTQAIMKVFCVMCGREAIRNNDKYECLGGHWQRCEGREDVESSIKNAPTTWAQANIKDPGLKMIVTDSLFCFKCGQKVVNIFETRFECANGHTMRYKNTDS